MATMKKESDYSKKLRDPRWQKKRLEILQRDKFSCLMCGDKQEELHVHHRQYEKDKDPWEVDNTSLVTVCRSCHNLIEESISFLRQEIDNPCYGSSFAIFHCLMTNESSQLLTQKILIGLKEHFLESKEIGNEN